MKLTILMMGIFSVNILASVYSQETLLDIDVRDESVRNVLKTIENESEFRFFYNDEFSDLNKKVTINLTDRKLEDILSEMLKNTEVSYKIMENNFVVLTPKKLIQQQRITGAVTDSQGEPLPGVTIQVKGTMTGAISGADGNYSVNITSGATTLIFSFVGYTTQEINIEGRTQINVVMQEEVTVLDEVIVTGYGVQRKSDVTGAIASVKNDELVERSVTSVQNALQGKVSGIQILTSSADPGSVGDIRVRGYNSNSASGPLVIIDGFQRSLSDVNVNDVESIEILKDAASAAIYGSQAGNGVILVTTKSGAASKGNVFYNGWVSFKNVLKSQMDVLDAKDYFQWGKEYGLFDETTVAAYWDGETDTNWADFILNTGVTHNHNLGFTGSNDRGSLYFSVNYTDEDGVVIDRQDISQRINVRLNADYKINNWLKFSASYVTSKQKSKTVSSGGQGSLMADAFVMDPFTKPYYNSYEEMPQEVKIAYDAGKPLVRDRDGNVVGVSQINVNANRTPTYHLYRALLMGNTDQTGMNINSNVALDATPVKGLTLTSRFSYGSTNGWSSSYSAPWYYSTIHNSSVYSLENSSGTGINYNWQNYANYSLKLGKNQVNAMAGQEFYYTEAGSISASTNLLTGYDPNFQYLDYSTDDAADIVGGSKSESSNMSYFGRMNWNYAQKYNIQVTYRADAFDKSKLSEQKRWGYFPSVSAGWTVSNEEWFSSLVGANIMSSLKIRGSWGVNGNIGSLSSYAYASAMSTGLPYAYSPSSGLITGIYPQTTLPNPELSWEKSEQYNVGLDARFLNDRLTLVLDWFDKYTVDLLGTRTPPLSSGATSQRVNIGKVQNRGVEVELGWNHKVGDFQYKITANMSSLKNKVIEGTGTRLDGFRNFNTAPYITYFEEGYPVWYLYLYKLDHIDTDTGEPVFADLNEDGQITSDKDRYYAGSGIPNLTYGLTVNLTYRNFSFTLFGQGTQGVDRQIQMSRPDTPTLNVQQWVFDQRWTAGSTNSKIPAARYFNTPNLAASDAWLYDASYFKIKQLQLGYDLPRSVLNKLHISNLKIYVSLDDWIRITRYPGIDPETSSNSGTAMAIDNVSYPTQKATLFGINVTL